MSTMSKCDKCGGPESTLPFYRKWGDDPMGVSVFCDEHALKKRMQDRLCIGVPLIAFSMFVLSSMAMLLG